MPSLPTITLSAALPVPFRSAEPVRVRFFKVEASEKVRLTKTVSMPSPAASTIVSSASSKRYVSLPRPPRRTSVPAPPSRLSSPSPPSRSSLPAPPTSRSSPISPRSRSSPSWPRRSSLPSLPRIRSAPAPPLIISSSIVPLMVSSFPIPFMIAHFLSLSCLNFKLVNKKLTYLDTILNRNAILISEKIIVISMVFRHPTRINYFMLFFYSR